MKRCVKYSIRFILIFLLIKISTDCFVFNNVYAQETLNEQNRTRTIKIEANFKITAGNECIEHKYICNSEKKAACSSDGFKKLNCINCSFSYKEIIPYIYVVQDTKEENKEVKKTSEDILQSENVFESANTSKSKNASKNKTVSEISLSSRTINAMDIFLTTLIVLSSICFARTIMEDVRIINWDMRQRAKHKKQNFRRRKNDL